MLSWSSADSRSPADVSSIADGHGDAGVRHGAELLAFAEAIARYDDSELAAARQRLVDVAGADAMVDAAAVAANFEMMTREADGTGARFPASVVDDRSSLTGTLGIDGLTSRR